MGMLYQILVAKSQVIHFLLSLTLTLITLANLTFMPPGVVKFYDGDNLTIIQGGIKTKVRLACIDAPELKQANGQSSRKILKSLITGKRFKLNILSRDRFGRLIAEVFIGKINVNKMLVEQGNAHFYNPSGKGCEEYSEAERRAKTGHLGVWKNGEDVESPSEFRRENH